MLVNLESMTTKPRADGGQQKLRRIDSREGRVLRFTDRRGQRGFFYGLEKRVAAGGELSHKGRGAALLQT